MKRLILLIPTAFAVTLLSASIILASTFWGGTVINVAGNDILKVRKWPSSTSQVVGTYANGANISLTGRCKNPATNQSFAVDAGGSANWKYSKMKKYNVWCQVMTDSAQLGWARGKFIWPE